MAKAWKVNEQVPKEVADQFKEVHPMLVQLLWNRGISNQLEFDQFLSPDYGRDVHDPFLFSRMRDAVDRIFKALDGGEVVMIHGDYDADGICGTAVLLSSLREVCDKAGWTSFEENRVRWYLPDREGDGYGMSFGTVERFKNEGVDLIITVDCGIANTDEIAKAYELGMEVIVVDHHQVPDVVTDKAFIIHPLVDPSYPFKKLAAVGVAYKVACAMYIMGRERQFDIAEGQEKWLLDLVSIATVTDMVPLVGENRTLEKYGLMVLNKTRRVGLLALMEAAGIEPGKLDTVDIGFRIGPRINASGRIAKADYALELLLEDDPVRARDLAERLNGINTERQKLSGDAVKGALKSVEVGERKFVAVVDNSIHIGIAGLVAGKLATETSLPSVVITKVGDHMVGSGRSPNGFHFVEAMDTCRDLMVAGGGHPQACGFKLHEINVDRWIDAMNDYAVSTYDPNNEPELEVDAELSLELADWDLVEGVERMEPYGMNNPTPQFVSRGLRVVSAERIGKTKTHLRISVGAEGSIVRKCIGFGHGDFADVLKMGDIIDLVYEIGVNEWQGSRSLQLQIQDIHKIKKI